MRLLLWIEWPNHLLSSKLVIAYLTQMVGRKQAFKQNLLVNEKSLKT